MFTYSIYISYVENHPAWQLGVNIFKNRWWAMHVLCYCCDIWCYI